MVKASGGKWGNIREDMVPSWVEAKSQKNMHRTLRFYPLDLLYDALVFYI